MLENDTLKNGTSRIGLYGSSPPPGQDYRYVENFQLKAHFREIPLFAVMSRNISSNFSPCQCQYNLERKLHVTDLSEMNIL